MTLDEVFKGAVCEYYKPHSKRLQPPFSFGPDTSYITITQALIHNSIKITKITLTEAHKQRLVQYLLERNIDISELYE